MQDDDDFPEFNLLKTTSPEQYKGLLPVLSSRIILENEQKEFTTLIELEKLAHCNLEELNNYQII
jgi:hypothetical protein